MSDVTNVSKAHAAIEADEASAIAYAILATYDISREVLKQSRSQHADNILHGNQQAAEMIRASQLPYRRVKLELAASNRSVYVLPGHIACIEEFEEDSGATLIFFSNGRLECLVKGHVDEIEARLNGEDVD